MQEDKVPSLREGEWRKNTEKKDSQRIGGWVETGSVIFYEIPFLEIGRIEPIEHLTFAQRFFIVLLFFNFVEFLWFSKLRLTNYQALNPVYSIEETSCRIEWIRNLKSVKSILPCMEPSLSTLEHHA